MPRKIRWWLLALIITLAAAGTGFVGVFSAEPSPDAIAAAEANLPDVRHVRRLSAPHENVGGLLAQTPQLYQSGAANLTWSPDGQRLAAYVHFGLGIIVWSSDGTYTKEFPRYTSFGLNSSLLGFISGHNEIITSPAAETNDPEGWKRADQNAFSVFDESTGRLVRSVPGPNPGKTFRENIAQQMAISPDQSLIAVIYHRYAGNDVGIYATRDWQRIATIDVSDKPSGEATALAFSPDGSRLAIARAPSNRIDIHETGAWKLLQSFQPFPTTQRPDFVRIAALTFSPDGKRLAVGSSIGGTFFRRADRVQAFLGPGTEFEVFPRDPLRVFSADDGALIASVSGFPGGFLENNSVAWSPGGDFIAFLDKAGQVRFWNPDHPAVSPVMFRLGTATSLVFSPDGKQIAIDVTPGAEMFDVIPRR